VNNNRVLGSFAENVVKVLNTQSHFFQLHQVLDQVMDKVRTDNLHVDEKGDIIPVFANALSLLEDLDI